MKRIVVKIGSSIIAPSGQINPTIVAQIAGDIDAVTRSGSQAVVVTSGAIASGVKALGLKRRPTKIDELQALASVGQIILMNHFSKAFSTRGLTCGQLLLTWEDFENRDRYLNVKHTLLRLLNQGIVPVINENDTVSTEEIKFGDNDKLSALVANLIEADMLLILSDVEGVYAGETLIRDVRDIDKDAVPFVRPHAKNSLTRGGMDSKLEAARVTTAAGVRMVIASGKKKNIIQSVVACKEICCTVFHPADEKVGAKERWIIFGKKEKGTLVVDTGAEKAIVQHGKSLLLPGIVSVVGEFHKGDAVIVRNQAGASLAKGIVSFSADHIRHRKNISREVIHRDSLVITKKR